MINITEEWNRQPLPPALDLEILAEKNIIHLSDEEPPRPGR